MKRKQEAAKVRWARFLRRVVESKFGVTQAEAVALLGVNGVPGLGGGVKAFHVWLVAHGLDKGEAFNLGYGNKFVAGPWIKHAIDLLEKP